MTASRTALQDKALGWYAQEHQLAPITSAHPTYYFRNKAGQEEQHSIIAIMNEYLANREAEKRQRRRATR